MRSTIIDLYKASQHDRIKLYKHLNALGERIYSGTGLKDIHYDCSKFDFCNDNNNWCGSGVSKDLSAISINDFIKKFPIPSMKTTPEDPKDYAIICEKASLEDRKTIYKYLEQLGHSMYKDTGFIKQAQEWYEGSPTTFYYNGEWTTGSCSKPRITVTDFIAKFIKPIVASPEPIKHQYKPGDSVKIRSDLKQGYGYTVYVNTEMAKLAGKIVKIASDSKRAKDGKTIWKLARDNFDWTDDLFESISATETPKKEPEMDIKVGDVYRNSSGNLNTITRVVGKNYVYKTATGREFNTDLHSIQRNWKKETSISVSTKTLTGFKPGDRVKVRSDLSESESYKMLSGKEYTDYVNPTMATYAGKIVTIESIDRMGHYYLKECKHNWVDEMFDGLESEQTPTHQTPIAPSPSPSFQIGDKVKLKDGLKDAASYNGITYFEVFKSNVTTGSISKVQESSEGYQYYINKIWYGEDALELDSSSSINPMKINSVRGTTTVTVATAPVAIGTPLGGTNQPTLKSEKKTMAQKLKETGLQILDQNKQAAIIAGKMEAGRILTKQVLKQIKPHLPIFVKGYLDTPLAPVIVANLVAAVGNHTQNKRVQQVSELMLLAAADATVQSFNLDKIIDDVLAGVKLPAGILTSDEE